MTLMSEVIVVPSDGSSVEEGEIIEYEEGEIIDDDDDAVNVVEDKKSELSRQPTCPAYPPSKGNDSSKSCAPERNLYSSNTDVDSFNVDKRRRRGGKVGSNNFRKYRENKFSGAASKRGSARGRKRNNSPFRSFSGKDINRDDDNDLSYDKKLEEYVKIKTKQKELERAEAEAAAANDVDMRTMPAAAQPIVPLAFESCQLPYPDDKQPENWADDVDPSSWNGKRHNQWDNRSTDWIDKPLREQNVQIFESKKNSWKDRNTRPPWIKHIEPWDESYRDEKSPERWGEQCSRNDPPHANHELANNIVDFPPPCGGVPGQPNVDKPMELPWQQPTPNWNLPPPPPFLWQTPPTWPPFPGILPWNQSLPWMNTPTPLDQQWNQCNQQSTTQSEQTGAFPGDSSMSKGIISEAISDSVSDDKVNDSTREEEPLPPGVEKDRLSPKKPSKVAFTIKMPAPAPRPNTVAPAFEANEDGSDEEEELNLRIEALRSTVLKRQAKYKERRGRRTTRWNDPEDPLSPILADACVAAAMADLENENGEKGSPKSPDVDTPASPDAVVPDSCVKPSAQENLLDIPSPPDPCLESPASPDVPLLNDNKCNKEETVDNLLSPDNIVGGIEAQVEKSSLDVLLTSKGSRSSECISDNLILSSVELSSEASRMRKSLIDNKDKLITMPDEKDVINNTQKEEIMDPQETDEQRLRRLVLLSFQRKKNTLLETDDSSQNSVKSQENPDIEKNACKEINAWEPLKSGETSSAINAKDLKETRISKENASKKKDDWDEADPDVLRAELLRHLVHTLPANKGKTEVSEVKDLGISNPATLAQEVASFGSKIGRVLVTKPSVTVKEIAKVEGRGGPVSREMSKTSTAKSDTDRLCQEWSEKMVPRLVINLEPTGSDSESDSELIRSVDQMLLEARLRSDFNKGVMAKASQQLPEPTKPSSSVAPVTPVAVRHLPEDRRKEYMMLKKMLALKEQQILAKRGQKSDETKENVSKQEIQTGLESEPGTSKQSSAIHQNNKQDKLKKMLALNEHMMLIKGGQKSEDNSINVTKPVAQTSLESEPGPSKQSAVIQQNSKLAMLKKMHALNEHMMLIRRGQRSEDNNINVTKPVVQSGLKLKAGTSKQSVAAIHQNNKHAMLKKMLVLKEQQMLAKRRKKSEDTKKSVPKSIVQTGRESEPGTSKQSETVQQNKKSHKRTLPVQEQQMLPKRSEKSEDTKENSNETAGQTCPESEPGTSKQSTGPQRKKKKHPYMIRRMLEMQKQQMLAKRRKKFEVTNGNFNESGPGTSKQSKVIKLKKKYYVLKKMIALREQQMLAEGGLKSEDTNEILNKPVAVQASLESVPEASKQSAVVQQINVVADGSASSEVRIISSMPKGESMPNNHPLNTDHQVAGPSHSSGGTSSNIPKKKRVRFKIDSKIPSAMREIFIPLEQMKQTLCDLKRKITASQLANAPRRKKVKMDNSAKVTLMKLKAARARARLPAGSAKRLPAISIKKALLDAAKAGNSVNARPLSLLSAAVQAAGPLKHRLPPMVIRPTVPPRRKGKRRLLSDPPTEGGASKRPRCKSPKQLTPAEKEEKLAKIRLTAILAVQELGNSVDTYEQWIHREKNAQMKVVEAQRLLANAEHQLKICSFHKENEAKAGANHYAKALETLNAWQSFCSENDEERIGLLTKVNKDMERLRTQNPAAVDADTIFANMDSIEPIGETPADFSVSNEATSGCPPSSTVESDDVSPSVQPEMSSTINNLRSYDSPSVTQSKKKKRRKRVRKRNRPSNCRTGLESARVPAAATSEITEEMSEQPKSAEPSVLCNKADSENQEPIIPSNLPVVPSLLTESESSSPLPSTILPDPVVTTQDSVWDDPDAVLCPYQLSGTCRDESCSFKHISH